jgi:hypothetical protein
LDRYEQFRRKYDPAYAAKVGGQKISHLEWPEEEEGAQFREDEDEDEDLYS